VDRATGYMFMSSADWRSRINEQPPLFTSGFYLLNLSARLPGCAPAWPNEPEAARCALRIDRQH
jgi:hypothetical protein